MKYTYFFLLTLMVFSVSSCKKILEKEPLDFVSDNKEYYNTAEKLEANIRGVYAMLQDGNLYGAQMLYMHGLEADEGYYAREGSTDGPQVYNFSAGNSRVNNFWAALYRGIARANALLANIDTNPEIAIEVRDRIRGEAMFLRGYYYFLLVQTYGGVPLKLEPTLDVEDVDIPRASAKEVYDQILIDMEAAEPLVPGIKELGFGGRVSKSAVRGILARVCLHMAGYPVRDVAKFENARDWAKKVMDDTEADHSLNPSFSQVFINYAQDKYDIKESIWEVEFQGNGTGGAYQESGQVGYLNGPYSTNEATIGNSWGGVKVTSKLYKAYEENHGSTYADGDTRRAWTIANFTYSGADKVFTASKTVTYQYHRYAAKFRREYETLKPKHRTQTPQNFPLLRFSDVLLMYAEADNEVKGFPSAEAVEAVEKVRRRALVIGAIRSFGVNAAGSGYNSPPTVTYPNGAPGSGASIKATVKDGKITGFTMDPDPVLGVKMGKDYDKATAGPTVAPYLTITPTNGGSGARANARLWNESQADLTVAQKATQEDFRNFIQNERLRELAFETLRKGDLIRWGIFVYEMKQVANNIIQNNLGDRFYLIPYQNVWEKYNLWPIPAKEMNLNNLLVQNPNW